MMPGPKNAGIAWVDVFRDQVFWAFGWLIKWCGEQLSANVAETGDSIADAVCQIHYQGQTGAVQGKHGIALAAADNAGYGDVADSGQILIDSQAGF